MACVLVGGEEGEDVQGLGVALEAVEHPAREVQFGHPSAQLGDLHRVGQPGVVGAEFTAGDDLALVRERPQSCGVQDPVDVVLEPRPLSVVCHSSAQGMLFQVVVAGPYSPRMIGAGIVADDLDEAASRLSAATRGPQPPHARSA
ncbi:MAG: hypothetical protein ACRDP3_21440 [Streptomyces sp.]|uniref:hypothetical protein n=1 Tax=Streptomyces sp. TaxID=1931 RepID=UPI003D6A960D